MKASWQSCTGDAAPRVVNMHGVRVVYMYEEGDIDQYFFCHSHVHLYNPVHSSAWTAKTPLVFGMKYACANGFQPINRSRESNHRFNQFSFGQISASNWLLNVSMQYLVKVIKMNILLVCNINIYSACYLPPWKLEAAWALMDSELVQLISW